MRVQGLGDAGSGRALREGCKVAETEAKAGSSASSTIGSMPAVTASYGSPINLQNDTQQFSTQHAQSLLLGRLWDAAHPFLGCPDTGAMAQTQEVAPGANW